MLTAGAHGRQMGEGAAGADGGPRDSRFGMRVAASRAKWTFVPGWPLVPRAGLLYDSPGPGYSQSRSRLLDNLRRYLLCIG